MAWWDGSAVGGDEAGEEQLSYVAFGAAVSEVSIHTTGKTPGFSAGSV